METKGARILITGSNRGIGKAVALRLAMDGAKLYLVVRKKESINSEEFKQKGAEEVIVIEAELNTRAGVSKLIDEIKDENIEILFNNAGILTGGLLENQPLDDVYDMFQVNINSLVHLTHAILPQMLKRKSGLIINHSSVSAVMNFPCASTYAASKAAVLAFTQSLRQELKKTGVKTLLLITPGIKTRMFDQIDDLYGQHISTPDVSISPEKYADMIREAIIEELDVLSPTGVVGFATKFAKYLPRLFEKVVSFKFHR
jgi:uncharacterized protein